MQQFKKGNRMGGKPSPFPLFKAERHAVGRALTNGTRLTRRDIAWLMGRGLGRVHHYRNPSTGNKAQLHANNPLPSQEGFGRAHQWNLHRGEANGSPKSIG